MLNQYRVNQWREAMALVAQFRSLGDGIRAARWLNTAGVIRQECWKPWDFEVLVWVCRCCMLAHAADGCGDCPEHNGDGLEPLSRILPADTLAMGGDHNDTCTRDDSGDCDCETITHSSSQCRGCGSWLHGERHAMTIFVNDRRNLVKV